MKELFIPYEEALALKELGFNEPCVATYFDNSGGEIKFGFGMFQSAKCNSEANTINGTHIGEGGCYVPLYQQAFEWFREEHGLWFRPDYPFLDHTTYSGDVYKLGEFSCVADIGDHYTCEEAELACLRKLIEIIKKK